MVNLHTSDSLKQPIGAPKLFLSSIFTRSTPSSHNKFFLAWIIKWILLWEVSAVSLANWVLLINVFANWRLNIFDIEYRQKWSFLVVKYNKPFNYPWYIFFLVFACLNLYFLVDLVESNFANFFNTWFRKVF